MSIWEKFGFGRYKGLFPTRRGSCWTRRWSWPEGWLQKEADTGHLLLAMLQTDHGPAAKFLAGKNIREPEPSGVSWPRAAAPGAASGPQSAGAGSQTRHGLRAHRGTECAPDPARSRSICSAPCWRMTGCTAGILLASMGVQLADAVRECRQLSGQFVLPYQMRTTVMRRGQPRQ